MDRAPLTEADVEFARTLAGRIRWARECNADCPSTAWPLEEQLAVALVLGNSDYISTESLCVTYPVAMAYRYVGKGRTGSSYRDLVEWINKIGDAVEDLLREAEQDPPEDASHMLR
jgi:hypothetical protein